MSLDRTDASSLSTSPYSGPQSDFSIIREMVRASLSVVRPKADIPLADYPPAMYQTLNLSKVDCPKGAGVVRKDGNVTHVNFSQRTNFRIGLNKDTVKIKRHYRRDRKGFADPNAPANAEVNRWTKSTGVRLSEAYLEAAQAIAETLYGIKRTQWLQHCLEKAIDKELAEHPELAESELAGFQLKR